MANITAFRPRPGITQGLVANQGSSNFARFVTNDDNYYIGNSDANNDAWIAYTQAGNPDPVAVQPNPPTVGDMWIPARSAQVFKLCPNAVITAVAKTGQTATLYITPGEGM